ncbi:MAG: cyclase family protein [Chloracidobacterium sp.]|nr:cyclase family protein [Chloracidobacterium sp.]
MIDLNKLGTQIDISIPLQFNGPQPNAYGVETATSKACEAGDIVGDTRCGGSVNFEQYTFIPHCNGTHIECVGHITDERISVLDCLTDVFLAGVLVSVDPENVDGGDLVITSSSLQAASVGKAADTPTALIVRTLPNDKFDEGKLVNHRIFWNVEPGSREINAATRVNSTITELIYVPNEVADGEYLLNLQIAPFVSDRIA